MGRQKNKKATPRLLKKRAHVRSGITERMRAKGYLTTAQVARLVGVHSSTVYRWIYAKKIKFLDVSGAYYVEWPSVRAMLGDIADIIELPVDTSGVPKAVLEGGSGDAPR